MRKIKLLLAAMLSVTAFTGVTAQTTAEHEAALASIDDGVQYRIYTDVDGTRYYVTIAGDLTSVKDESGVFTFDKMTGGTFEIGGNTAVGIQISSPDGMRFTNPPLNGDYANLNPGHFCTTSSYSRAEWECQVFFLNEDGKYAIRSCNTAYGTSSWPDAGRTYWTYSVAPVAPLYSYSAAYVWNLEECVASPEQAEASAKVQAWPTYIQNAAGLVSNAGQFSSNAKETTEGSFEALLDDVYTTFFHSAWTYAVNADHYLQAELTEPAQKFQFYFKKRSQNNSNRPTEIVISASSDGENFTEVKSIDSGLPTEEDDIDYLSDVVDLGAEYKYVRFTVTATNNAAREGNDHVFFTFSEFYILPGIDVVAAITNIYNNRHTYAFDLTDEEIAEIQAADIALKSAISTVNVTYELYNDSGELIDSKTVVQTPYSDVSIPLSLLTQTGYYDYTPSGTVGETDCTITVVRSLKPAVVSELTQLSDNKAYTITCDRGRLIVKDGYLASTAYSAYADEEPSTFAIISYEGNRYIYSIADGKFVTNTGALAEMPTNGVYDAVQIEAIDGWPVPYFMFYFTVGEYAANYGLNTNGNNPSYERPLCGIVIDNWMDADEGNMYYMVAESDFDPTEAIEALDARYHTVVKYVVRDTGGNVIFASDPVPAMKHDYISELPTEYRRVFYSYNDVDVTVENLETVVEFTATWNGPFEISTGYTDAHWYDMAMRGTWYVTSAVKDDDGAYLTQNANTLGLVEESYHWAFLGNGYDGFKVINKEAGDGKSLGWTYANQSNQGIPTMMDDSDGFHAWNIVPSENYDVPSGSFCLNVPGTDLYVNQYGGPGGSVKFWESTNNISDPGSAFTIMEIPNEFSEFVASDIVPALDAAGYFALTDAAKDKIGFNPACLTNCSFEEYKIMRENLNSMMGDFSNFILPETGYYILKNKKYNQYLGINPDNAKLYGNFYGNYFYQDAAKQVVKLTRVGNNTYTISLMGKYAPIAVVKDGPVTAGTEEEAGVYTVSIPTIGYAAFQSDTEDPFSVLHCRAEGNIVGWPASEEASQWAVTNATSIPFYVGEAGYATAYLPFPINVPEGVTAYTGRISGDKLWLQKQEGTVPAQTAVVLKGNSGMYEFAITEDAAPVENNDLKGTLEPVDAVGKYVLSKPEGQPIAFYLADTGTIDAGKAYLSLPSHIKVFYFAGDEATGIVSPLGETEEGAAIYNLAGQRVNKARKGIYIINGKKVLE